jgi:hypothetical protein
MRKIVVLLVVSVLALLAVAPTTQAQRGPTITVSAGKLRLRLLAGDACESYARVNHWIPNPPTQQLNLCWAYDAENCVKMRGPGGRQSVYCDLSFTVKQPGRVGANTLHCHRDDVRSWLTRDGKIAIIHTPKRVAWLCDAFRS